MTKVRIPKQYQIKKHRFLEVYHYCMQYNDWKEELEGKIDTVKGICYTGMPGAAGSGDETEKLAMRRMELRKKIELIEQTAVEADLEIYRYIIKNVTEEGITYNYMRDFMNIPCGKNRFYSARRRFYYLLSQKI